MDGFVLLVLLPGLFDSSPNECNRNQTIRLQRRGISDKELAQGTGEWASVCEGDYLSLECPHGKAIRIHEGDYGRNDTETCGKYSEPILCSAKSSFGIVHQRCNGKRKCFVDATNYEFGDPCRGINKLLRAKYSCEPVTGEWLKSEIVCESKEKEISCPSGTVIVVKDAFYGRNDTRSCMKEMTVINTKCSSEKAFGIINDRCHLKSNCSLLASNALFGDPCSWTYKYLQVEYGCSAVLPEKIRRTVTIQHNHKRKLTCPNGMKVMIASAWYTGGTATADSICGNTFESLHNDNQESNCNSALEEMKRRCNMVEECVLLARNSCPGPKIKEDLEVEYNCIEDYVTKDNYRLKRSFEQNTVDYLESIEEIVCENYTKIISCSKGEEIKILEAEYGRLDDTTCQQPRMRDLQCEAWTSMKIVSDACNGKQECVLVSQNDVFGDPCVGTYKYLRVNYSCTAVPEDNNTTRDLICGNNNKTITCPDNGVIVIKNAFYGRRNSMLCHGMNSRTTTCSAGNVTNALQDRCNGKSSCNLRANNRVFGNPCYGTTKYLEVEYGCVAGQDYQNLGEALTGHSKAKYLEERICEDDSMTITCPNGKAIKILVAEYGRRDNTTCLDPMMTDLKCGAWNSTVIVREACNGKQECVLVSTNGVFGDPCPGTYKYLRVKYSCSAGQFEDNEGRKKSEIVCESNSKPISCPNNGIINIKKASYGRTINNICPGENTHVTNCHAESTYGVVTNSCNGKQYCSLESNYDLFGDPCVGTTKYLEVEYDCQPGQFEDNEGGRKSEIVCDSNSKPISCPNNGIINIKKASYGRTISNICPGQNTHVTNCRAESTYGVVTESCNGKHYCSLESNYELFGDPCVGTTKYLEVEYDCQPAQVEDNDGRRKSEIVCESNSKHISCPNNGIINIKKASYGRTISNICPGENTHVTNCHAESSYVVVSDSCNGMHYCNLESNHELFGDPCFGTTKYLEVEYDCQPGQIEDNEGRRKSEIVCESNNKPISCPNNGTIYIKKASYGRTISNICPGQYTNVTNCYAESSYDVVSNSCNGKKYCSLESNNELFGDPCVDTTKYLDVEYVCQPGQFEDNEGGWKSEIVCESNSKPISCPNNGIINIKMASYGRTISNICPGQNINVTNCHAESTYDVISNSCNGKKYCSLDAYHELFGDPCVGTTKYLDVEYDCQPGPFEDNEGGKNSEIVCESNSKPISCPNNGIINIKKASYGRTISNICPGQNINVTNCRAESSYGVVSNSCNGKQYCSLESNYELFGDPCVDTTKYLEVEYDCQPGGEVRDPISRKTREAHFESRGETVCEDKSKTISCPKGEVIDILEAEYGRRDPEICPPLFIFNIDCVAENSTSIVSHACNEKQECLLESANSVYGDPCPLTPKYLSVNYSCNPGQIEDNEDGRKSEIVCESNSKPISCPNNGIINITKASYGRTISNICPGQNTHVTNCHAESTYGVVTESCNDKHHCSLEANHELFGDPCVGTTKYLEVEYDCHPGQIEDNKVGSKSEIVCESNSKPISCPNNGTIYIKKASYGRTISNICPGQNTNVTNCYAESTYGVVSNSCNGKHHCSLEANHELFGDPCVGTTKYLEVEYVCQPGQFEGNEGGRKSSEIVCEFKSMFISCPNNGIINIKKASYGRTISNICPGQNTHVTNCRAESTYGVVANSCNGKGSCILESENGLFGDPCVGTTKYLEVEYDCQPGPFEDNVGGRKSSEIVCEFKSMFISCPNNGIINIKKASYGRTISNICPGQNTHVTSCRAESTYGVVANSCNGKGSCILESKNGLFGDPCVGTTKYLEVEYDCQPGQFEDNVGGTITKVVCESNSKLISCPNNGIINIKKASYGRTISNLCPGQNTHVTNCRAESTYGVVANSCNGKGSCILDSKNGLFGDPCVGTTKYLEVEYDCQPGQFEDNVGGTITKVVCESNSKLISCPNNGIINIKKASYGRTISNLCPGQNTHVTNCRAESTYGVVANSCNGKGSCILDSKNGLFGDPCVGTTKYLEVEYDCQPDYPSETPISMGDTLDGNSMIEENILEHSFKTLRCPKGSYISIVAADYGSANCKAESTFRIVSSQCNQKESCLVFSKDEVFGDPCVGIIKHLTVKFQCKPASAVVRHVVVADENRRLYLTCPSGTFIAVYDAFYGVTQTRDNSYYKKCGSDNSLSIVSEMCNLKDKCVVPATNDVFENPCPGEVKKLKVKYDCVAVSKYSYAIIPEREAGTVSCPAGTTIRISHAAYGIVYGTPNNQLASTRCAASNTREIVSSRCDYMKSCQLSSSNKLFGDPCHGIQKDLVVEYRCEKDKTIRGFACQDSVLVMDCPLGSTIGIISAYYGRNHPFICNPDSSPIHSRGCQCANSTSAVYRMCQGKSYCAVGANNGIFGNPCEGIKKYLEVEYMCSGRITEDTSTDIIPENSLRNVTFYLKNVDEDGCTNFAAQIKRSGEESWRTAIEGQDFRQPQTITGLDPDTSYRIRVVPRDEKMSPEDVCQPSVTVDTWAWIDVK